MTRDPPADPVAPRERWYRAAFEHSPDAILLYDDEGTVLEASPRACDYLGYDHDDLVGRPIWDFSSGDPEAIRRRWDQMSVGDTSTFEGEHTRADGTAVPVQVHVSRVDLGDAVDFVGSVRDISEQRARERQFQEVHDRMEFALDSTDTIVYELDPETGEETRHGPFDRLFGLPSSAVGTIEAFYQRAVHPEDRPATAAREQTIIAGEADTVELEFRTHPDYGEVRWVRSVLSAVDDDPRTIIGLTTDVTETVRRREALETLHAATRDLMAAESAEEIARIGSATTTDVLELAINSVNRYDPVADAIEPVAWSVENEALFGGRPPSIPAGEGLVWRALEAGEPRRYDDLRQVEGVLNEATPFRSELHVPVGDDRIILISSETADAFDEADVALARVLAANMETAFVRLADERALERQNERLEEFASVVSHDLRNPLNVATGRLELLGETVESEHLEPIENALDRMARIIEDVLWLAREGRDIGETEPVALDELLASCWRLVADDAAGVDLVIRTDAYDTLGTVEADANRLRQAVENLLRNALEHGGEAVTVTAGRLEDGFYVEDDGQGIAEDDREAVFESGYSTSESGTGFGLRIVRQVVEAHGWTIRATEGADGGARFAVTGVAFVGG